MCIISEKIKFCTCNPGFKSVLESFWMLYRYQGDKLESSLGDPKIPSSFLDPNFILNACILEKRLNEPDAFDVSLNFKDKDLLLIVIKYKNDEFSYYFEFRNRSWQQTEEDAFGLMNSYKKVNKSRLEKILK